MRAFLRPRPVFSRDAEHLGYVAARSYHPGSEWVASGAGIAYRWWEGDRILVVHGTIYHLGAQTSYDDPDAVISTGVISNLGPLVWKPIEDGDPWGDRYLAAYADRMASYGEAKQLDNLEDGDYVITKETGPGWGYAMVPAQSLSYLHAPRDYDGIRDFIASEGIFGLVFVARDEDGNDVQATVFRDDFPADTSDAIGA